MKETLLRKFAVALGFNHKNVDKIVTKALILADKKVDLDTFIDEMQHIDN